MNINLKKIIFVMSGLLAFIVVLGGILIVYKKSQKIQMVNVQSALIDIKPPESQKLGEFWLEDFSLDDKSFAYPTTELFVKFDFSDNINPATYKRIEISELDEYKFFCVTQVLKQNEVESTYYKNGEHVLLMIFIEDERKFKKLLEDLKYYRIQYTLK